MHRILPVSLIYRVFGVTLFALMLVGCGEATHKSSQGNRPHKNQKLTDFVAVTTIGNLNMRIEPNLDTTRVQVLEEGMVLSVLGRSAEKVKVGNAKDFWYHVRTERGLTGWVYGAYLVLVPEDERDKAARIALQKIREQKVRVIKALAGYWQQKKDSGAIGPYRLRIHEDGSYFAFSRQGRWLYQGDIEVILKRKKLQFSQDTSFGSSIRYYHDEEGNYGMYYSRYGNHFKMQRAMNEKEPAVADLLENGYKKKK